MRQQSCPLLPKLRQLLGHGFLEPLPPSSGRAYSHRCVHSCTVFSTSGRRDFLRGLRSWQPSLKVSSLVRSRAPAPRGQSAGVRHLPDLPLPQPPTISSATRSPQSLKGNRTRHWRYHSNLNHSLPVQYLLPQKCHFRLFYLETLCILFGRGEGRGLICRITPGREMGGWEQCALPAPPTSTELGDILGTHLTHWLGNG